MNFNERLRVLYVDDDQDSFEMLKVMLDLSQIEVGSALSVAEALTLAGSEHFDLYLLDSGLPDGSGLSLCRTLRAVDPTVPVLFYSGNAHADAISKGMDAGAAGYITKPNSDKLAQTIIQLTTNPSEPRESIVDFRFMVAST
jgi:DNA-binding response OmpR family regulator